MCDFASQNSVTLPRLCMKLKATEACFVTLAALSRWIFTLLFIAVRFLASGYSELLCLSYRQAFNYAVKYEFHENIQHTALLWCFYFGVSFYVSYLFD